MGKPLKPITHPLRADLPIFIGAEGPKNVEQTAAIADGWLPLYYSPYRQEVYADQLAGAPEGFEIACTVMANINDDLQAALYPVKAMLGFYIGGMGSKQRNFHKELMARMGFADEAERIQDLFFEGKREEAIACVPDAFADEISLCGPRERIREKLQDWQASPVTSLLINGDARLLREMAELVL
jgi:alkanesulfonate monooxygenase SsuD/methylene tetrahydromethanopterin reductase-like flavin-dependent oxidoreductase (luciferase family)